MKTQTEKLLKEIEEIKARLIFIELRFIESERARKDDVKAVKQALKEYKAGKTTPLDFSKLFL